MVLSEGLVWSLALGVRQVHSGGGDGLPRVAVAGRIGCRSEGGPLSRASARDHGRRQGGHGIQIRRQ